MLTLSDLFQQDEQQPPIKQEETDSVPTADLLADQEVALALTLSPAASFTERTVLGAIGIPGHAPQFIHTAVGIEGVMQVVQTLYAKLSPPTASAPPPIAVQTTEAETIATTAAETPKQGSILDIF